MPLQIRLNGATSGPASASTRAPWSQPKTTIGRSLRSALKACCSRRRSVATLSCGMSMPLTSSATWRNGVDDGHAPAQMPQLAHRSASTCASSRPGLPFGCGTIVIAA